MDKLDSPLDGDCRCHKGRDYNPSISVSRMAVALPGRQRLIAGHVLQRYVEVDRSL
jgi:hypothetical protein